ncbi:MAG: radical SAM protein [Adlercreutzia sp.]|uniref:radical SAM protein n=1 Tax=uncultured Adlercreutzia sp. TaxID=875803 RepID=UPI00216EF45D|nr:radical SAM protein [uncultured Adlercreutzia sp.]MCI8424432.1 radical SAM protein [Adlercreutzia sp.]
MAEYEAIEREYVESLEMQGIAFGERAGADASARRRARVSALVKKGVRSLNGGASLSCGFLSSACRACVGDCGSRTFYINLKCHRGCYFCFNPNQVDYERHLREDAPWRKAFEDFRAEVPVVTHVALTGGEPLLVKDKALDFLAMVHEEEPQAHVRLYTSGAFFDEDFARQASALGLDEIRFSVKLDEGDASVKEVLAALTLAREFIPSVMVEMPVIPGQEEAMRGLLRRLDELEIDGVNLLEFCFPLHNWGEFAKRGFRIKNPPFEVLYNYQYAGALPVEGSDEACLDLLEFAMDEGLSLGVHYCTLANKNIDAVLQVNRRYDLDPALYELGEDGFFHVAKVFDQDVAPVRAALASAGAPYLEDGDDGSIAFHARWTSVAERAGAVPARSVLTIEESNGVPRLRELKLAG